MRVTRVNRIREMKNGVTRSKREFYRVRNKGELIKKSYSNESSLHPLDTAIIYSYNEHGEETVTRIDYKMTKNTK